MRLNWPTKRTLSIIKFRDKCYCVVFEFSKCLIENFCTNEVIFIYDRKDNVYTINVEKVSTQDKCFSVLKNDSWLWHRRLEHASISTISTLSKEKKIFLMVYLVLFLKKIKFVKHVNLENKWKAFLNQENLF